MQGIFVEKGTIKESIWESPPMILDYKNKTIFAALIFQDVIYFIYQQSVDWPGDNLEIEGMPLLLLI